MLHALLAPLGRIPLARLQRFGARLGSLGYRLGGRFARLTRENVRQARIAGADGEPFFASVAAHAGRSVCEVPYVWFRRRDDFLATVHPDPVWDEVLSRKQAHGGSMIMLTPHLGSFETAGRFLAEHFPVTIMYRPPKLRWLEPLLFAGRRHGQAKLVPADLGGVRALLRALRAGEAVGLLPDQTPGRGEGIWAPFFGRPAYTVSLVARLQQATGAPIVFGFAERLPEGAGFRLRGKLLDEPLPRDPLLAATALNSAIEDLVRLCPAQYLWSYNRYKVPAGVARPAAASA